MDIRSGDIWDWQEAGILVIPTNIGWNTSGAAVMGAGLAADAALRFPDLKIWYGAECRKLKHATPPLPWPDATEACRLILFPTKRLNERLPHYSWRDNASLELIERGLVDLALLGETLPGTRKIVVPMLGTGCGHLKEASVRMLMEEHLENERFIILKREKK